MDKMIHICIDTLHCSRCSKVWYCTRCASILSGSTPLHCIPGIHPQAWDGAFFNLSIKSSPSAGTDEAESSRASSGKRDGKGEGSGDGAPESESSVSTEH